MGSFGLRADRLKSYIGKIDKKQNIEIIKGIINGLAFEEKKKISFQEFNNKISKEIFGIVLTAHPTFGMTFNMMLELAKLATSKNNNKNLTDKELKGIVKEVFKTEQRPEKKITLDFEHSLSMSALKFLQASLRTFYEAIIDVSKKLFPDNYHKITPQIFRLHTWVGYDVDGRGDIFWSDSFSKRLKVKIEQLDIYQQRVNKIIKLNKDKGCEIELSQIKNIITNAIKINSEALTKFTEKDFVNDLNSIKQVSNFLHKNKDKLLTNSLLILEKISSVLKLLSRKGFE